MDKTKLGLLAGGAALTLGGVLAYFYYKDEQKAKQGTQPKIPLEVVLNVCKELKKQMFNVSLQILEIRVRIQKQLSLGAQLPNNQSIDEVVQDVGLNQIANIKKLLCTKFEVDQNDFQHALEVDFINNDQLMQINNEVEELFLNACRGIAPNLQVDEHILEQFSKEKIYSIHSKFFKVVSKKYIQAFQEMKSEGEIEMSLENPKFFKKNRELRIPETKKELLLSEGFDKCPDSPREVFDKITIKYRQEDSEFAQKVQEVEKIFQDLIEDLAVQPFKYNEQSPEILFQEK